MKFILPEFKKRYIITSPVSIALSEYYSLVDKYSKIRELPVGTEFSITAIRIGSGYRYNHVDITFYNLDNNFEIVSGIDVYGKKNKAKVIKLHMSKASLESIECELKPE
jgi:hypothetical protein